MRCHKYPSGRGAHAFGEFAQSEQGNKETKRYPPWANPQDAGDPFLVKGSGLATPIHYISSRRDKMITTNEIREVVKTRYGKFAETVGHIESC